MEFKFCPFCGKELNTAFVFCPYCGGNLGQFSSKDTADNSTPTQNSTVNEKDLLKEILAQKSVMDVIIAEEKQKSLSKIKVLCVQGRFDEAKELCAEYLDADPSYFRGYVEYVRIASKNYTVFDGDEIEQAISMVFTICPKLPDGSADEFLDYLARRDLRDCEIENGVLKKYNGSAESLTVSDRFVSKIGRDAFSGNSTLVSVKLSKGITVIDKYAFKGCNKLQIVDFPGAARVDNLAFSGCKALKTVKFGDDLREIGYQAFEGVGAPFDYAHIFIPENIKYIDYSALQNSHCIFYFACSEEEVKENFSAFYDEHEYDSTLRFNCTREQAE